MKPQNPEWELMQHRLQNRQQVPLADGLHATHDFPLRNRIDGVEVIQSRLTIVVTLMDGIDPQIARPPPGVGFAPLGDCYLSGLRATHSDSAPAIKLRAPQVVDVGNRDPRQPRVLLFAKDRPLPLQNVARGWPG